MQIHGEGGGGGPVLRIASYSKMQDFGESVKAGLTEIPKNSEDFQNFHDAQVFMISSMLRILEILWIVRISGIPRICRFRGF